MINRRSAVHSAAERNAVIEQLPGIPLRLQQGFGKVNCAILL